MRLVSLIAAVLAPLSLAACQTTRDTSTAPGVPARTVMGSLVGTDGVDHLTVRPTPKPGADAGNQPVTFTTHPDAPVFLDGDATRLSELPPGAWVDVTVDPYSKTATAVHASRTKPLK